MYLKPTAGGIESMSLKTATLATELSGSAQKEDLQAKPARWCGCCVLNVFEFRFTSLVTKYSIIV